MVLITTAGLSSSSMTPWPRMHPGQKNPFQNAPGLFIYALPNLAGTCPFSYSDTDLFCRFTEDSNNAPNQHHQHHRCCHSPAVTSRCCHHHHDPPSESAAAEPLAAPPTKEGAPDTELLLPPRSPTSLSPSDESHFDLDDGVSASSLTEDGAAEPEEQEERNEPVTPTQSHPQSSPTVSDFPETMDSENVGGEGDGEVKDEKKKKKKRGRGAARRRHRKQPKSGLFPGHVGNIRGPRALGLSGPYYDWWVWHMYSQAPHYPPPPFLSWPPPTGMYDQPGLVWCNGPAPRF